MTDNQKLQEFARIFRCTLETAPIYVARIHERMGHEVPMESIIAAMKKIAPKKLSMETIVGQLTKMERAPARTRAPKVVDEEPAAAPKVDGGAARRSKTVPPPQKMSSLQQITTILNANWARGRKHGLKPPVMTAERFVRTTQSIAGVPKPSVTRILQALQKLDRRDVLLTPNLVADEINESDET
ncbi:MAG TPA: hypothetical protein VJG32_22610 [Anaerolineae bacterium]|nr:hypothetical protein [Anaerolineae bacterium]